MCQKKREESDYATFACLNSSLHSCYFINLKQEIWPKAYWWHYLWHFWGLNVRSTVSLCDCWYWIFTEMCAFHRNWKNQSRGLHIFKKETDKVIKINIGSGFISRMQENVLFELTFAVLYLMQLLEYFNCWFLSPFFFM